MEPEMEHAAQGRDAQAWPAGRATDIKTSVFSSSQNLLARDQGCPNAWNCANGVRCKGNDAALEQKSVTHIDVLACLVTS